MTGRLADVPLRAVNPLQQRFEGGLKHLVVLWAAEPALRLELHILYTARRAGQSRQFIGQGPICWLMTVCKIARQVQFLMLEDFLLLGASWQRWTSFFWPLTMSVR